MKMFLLPSDRVLVPPLNIFSRQRIKERLILLVEPSRMIMDSTPYATTYDQSSLIQVTCHNQ